MTRVRPLTPAEGISLVALSSALLTFEVILTRLFAVARTYHFAFLVVSLALLGFGAGGTLLALRPLRPGVDPGRLLAWGNLAFAAAVLVAYGTVNHLPFDPFTLPWDRPQGVRLTLQILALALPFLVGGWTVGALLARDPEGAGRTYALNLVGSGLGCLPPLLLPPRIGGEETVLFAALLPALTAPLPLWTRGRRRAAGATWGLILVLLLALLGPARPLLTLRLSPYKPLSRTLRQPGVRVRAQVWTPTARIDLLEGPTFRALPGLSVRAPAVPPSPPAFFVDGEGPYPAPTAAELEAVAPYLPLAAALQLRPGARVLVLGARGGVDAAAALALGARQVWAVEPEGPILRGAPVYQAPEVVAVAEAERTFLARTRETFDVIVLSLTEGYRPIRWGAYSLREEYRYTVEALTAALGRLEPDGILVVSRWLQTPPSEWLRAFLLAVAAVEARGGDPARQILAFRGYNLGTLLVGARPFSPQEVAAWRAFLDARAYDPVWAPDLDPQALNRHNRLPEPAYHRTFRAFLTAPDREAWLAAYPYDVRPPTDDRPFFASYARLRQLPRIWEALGRTWAPFGGAGILVLLILTGLTALLAGGLILLPLLLSPAARSARPGGRPLLHFAALGAGYLLVEIPLLQRTILYLGQPALAFAVVLFALLVASGAGSRLSGRLPARALFPLLLTVGGGTLAGLPLLHRATLAWPLPARIGLTVAGLTPLGILLGMPFPQGLRRLEAVRPGWVPWAWGVNGAVSVVASPLAALLALTLGFRAVFLAAGLAYAGAGLTVRGWAAPSPGPTPPRAP